VALGEDSRQFKRDLTNAGGWDSEVGGSNGDLLDR